MKQFDETRKMMKMMGDKTTIGDDRRSQAQGMRR